MTETDHTVDGDWITEALDQFEGPLTRYALRITGELERARDVVQDTFLKLCREDPDQLDGHLSQWLFTVCRNRALDVRKKEARMTTQAPAEPRSRDATPETATPPITSSA